MKLLHTMLDTHFNPAHEVAWSRAPLTPLGPHPSMCCSTAATPPALNSYCPTNALRTRFAGSQAKLVAAAAVLVAIAPRACGTAVQVVLDKGACAWVPSDGLARRKASETLACSAAGPQSGAGHSQSWHPGRLQRLHQKLVSLSWAMMNQPCKQAGERVETGVDHALERPLGHSMRKQTRRQTRRKRGALRLPGRRACWGSLEGPLACSLLQGRRRGVGQLWWAAYNGATGPAAASRNRPPIAVAAPQLGGCTSPAHVPAPIPSTHLCPPAAPLCPPAPSTHPPGSALQYLANQSSLMRLVSPAGIAGLSMGPVEAGT